MSPRSTVALAMPTRGSPTHLLLLLLFFVVFLSCIFILLVQTSRLAQDVALPREVLVGRRARSIRAQLLVLDALALGRIGSMSLSIGHSFFVVVSLFRLTTWILNKQEPSGEFARQVGPLLLLPARPEQQALEQRAEQNNSHHLHRQVDLAPRRLQ